MLTLAFTLCICTAIGSGPFDDTVRVRYERLQTRWATQVEQLAAQVASQGDEAAALSIRNTLASNTIKGAISIRLLTAYPGADAPESVRSSSGSSGETQWQITFARMRKQHAKELFELANTAFRAGDVSFCYDLVREVIDNDPDHGRARALMGFTKYRSDWVTPFAAGKLRGGFVWNARFGWIPKTHLAHYEQGEQLWKGQWLPADEVAKYRSNWVNAWEVETDHYVVRTNVSLERGVELATKLEKLYSIFFRLFAGFFNTREQMGVLFDSPNRRPQAGAKTSDQDHRAAKKFRVHFYRTRDEYFDALRPYIKTGLEVSTGMYLTGTRVAYFYQNNPTDDATVIHEATHQLFAETREHRHGEGSQGNYWVLEGIACYMESFRENGDHIELGSWDSHRLSRARRRIDKFTSLEELIALDRKDFERTEVVNLYAQSDCFVHFLMHYDGGRFRDALVNYLVEVYLGRADQQTLTNLLGVDLATLNEQFRRHVTEAREP